MVRNANVLERKNKQGLEVFDWLLEVVENVAAVKYAANA